MSFWGGVMLGLFAREETMPSPESETKSRDGVVAGEVDSGGVGTAVGLDVLDRVQGDVPEHICSQLPGRRVAQFSFLQGLLYF